MTKSRDHTQLVTQSEAEVGSSTDGKIWSPQRVIQAIAANASASPLTTKGDLFTYDTDDQRLAIGTNDFVLTADSAQPTGLKWALPSVHPTDERIYNHAGILRNFIGVTRWYPMRDITISEIRANVGDPSTVQDILINIKKNGAIVITDLTIPQTTYRSVLDTTVIAMTTTDYITVDIKQIGTGNAGQDLTVNFKYN